MKEAGTAVGHGARDAAHATASGTKKAERWVANTTEHGYHATKNAIHNATRDSGTSEKAKPEEEKR